MAPYYSTHRGTYVSCQVPFKQAIVNSAFYTKLTASSKKTKIREMVSLNQEPEKIAKREDQSRRYVLREEDCHQRNFTKEIPLGIKVCISSTNMY